MTEKVSTTKSDDYWTLPTYLDLSKNEMHALLISRGYNPGTHNDKEDLKRHLRRCDLGLLSYVPITNHELRLLIQRRGIETTFAEQRLGQRVELIGALEYADYRPKFERFMSLPPELRSRVYEFYFAGFKKRPHAPKQPPLTLTCSLIRKEALPMFYSTCTFEFNLLQLTDPCRNRPLTRRLIMPNDFRLWMYSTSPRNLADIKHVVVNVCRYVKGFGLATVFLSFMAADPKGEDPRPILLVDDAQHQVDLERLKKRLATFAGNRPRTYSGAGSWMEDFFLLRRKIEGCLRR